ncbi:MAG: ParB/RepB/Spo0J family partition protein [Clostridiaceae bacterium]|nr:ParB/RepB/Spo0J family partition protein [Clostridiaceae bacterium]
MPPDPRLSEDQVAAMRARKASDPSLSFAVLGKEFGISKSWAARILAASTTPAPAPTLAVAPYAKLHPSPLNPRKRFDPVSLDDLAASVAKEGVLLPLLVRHHPQQQGEHEIIAGERRWRAVGLLVDRQVATQDFPIPIRLVDPCDDRKLLELALTENVARKDMTPLEEAEAFAQLVDKGAGPSEIADVVGLTTRTVQKRLRLIKDLTPKVRTALSDAEITVEFANVLAAYCRKSHQDDVLTGIKNGWYRTSAALKESLLQNTIPEHLAAFDTSKYSGSWAVDEETGERFFADPDLFRRLQVWAAKARARSLQKEVPWVEIWDAAENKRFSEYSKDFTKRPDHPNAGAIISIASDGKMEVHQGFVRTKDLEAEKRVEEGKPAVASEPMTKAHYLHAHRRKTEAMQAAVLAAPVHAMRLVCAALLGSQQAVKIEPQAIEQDERIVAPAVQAIVDRHCSALKKSAVEIGRTGPRLGDNYGLDHAEIWKFLADLSFDDVIELFAALVALRVGTFSGWNPSLGDDPGALAVAQSLGLVGTEGEAGLTLLVEDLEGCRREALLSVARAADIGGDLDGMKAAALKEYISGTAAPGFVLPSLRFGAKQDLEAMLAGKPHPKVVAEAFSKASNRFDMSALIGDQLQDWDPAAKLSEIARDIQDDDSPESEDEIRAALISGINALQRRPLDRRIADACRFDPQGINVGAQYLIDTLFEIHRAPDTYQVVQTLGDAVAFVCDAFSIERSQRAAQ